MGNEIEDRDNGSHANLSDAIWEIALSCSRVMKDPAFLEKFDGWAREISTNVKSYMDSKLAIQRERLTMEKERVEKWYGQIRIYTILRSGLSFSALAAIVYLAVQTKIEPAVLSALFTGVIASLFIQPRKE